MKKREKIQELRQEEGLTQIEPLISPQAPSSTDSFRYYLLEPLRSPPISAPNALGWQPYSSPKEFFIAGFPQDPRRAYGHIDYEQRLEWSQLKKYNMLPFDYMEGRLFDLWLSLGENVKKVKEFVQAFYALTEDDPGLRRLEMVVNLFHQGVTLARIDTELDRIGIEKP